MFKKTRTNKPAKKFVPKGNARKENFGVRRKKETKRRKMINHVRNYSALAQTDRRQEEASTNPATENTTRGYEKVTTDATIDFGQCTRKSSSDKQC